MRLQAGSGGVVAFHDGPECLDGLGPDEVDGASPEAGARHPSRDHARHGRCDLDHRVELGRDDLEPLAQRAVARGERHAHLGEVAGFERGDRLGDALVLGDDVLGASVRHRVHPGAAADRWNRRDVPERRDRGVVLGDRGDGRLALAPPEVVLGAVEVALRARVQDDDADVGRQRHRPPLERAAVQQDRGTRDAARLRELVHQPALDADVRRSPRAGRCRASVSGSTSAATSPSIAQADASSIAADDDSPAFGRQRRGDDAAQALSGAPVSASAQAVPAT